MEYLSNPLVMMTLEGPGLGLVGGTYNAFLYKHRVGNPGGQSELFERTSPGQFKLVRPLKYGLD